jgi:hypothetical protein
MGHERTGTLPKSKRWRDIVTSIGALTGGEFDVGAIADETLKAVRLRFLKLEHDPAPLATFAFLVELSVAALETGNVARPVGLDGRGVQMTPLALAAALHSRLATLNCEPEYREIAAAAGADALALWYQDHRVQDRSLFEDFDQADQTWAKLGAGGGFCDLSRLFFAKFVERYLSYFLEREASRAAPSLSHREQVRADLAAHLDDVSQHAFETSRITQSFAAGWFNKHSSKGMPSQAKIRGFFDHALSKLRDEMAREGVNA